MTRLSVTVTKYWKISLNRGKVYFGSRFLMFHSVLAWPCFFGSAKAQYIIMEHMGEEACSLAGGWETDRKREGLRLHWPHLGHA